MRFRSDWEASLTAGFDNLIPYEEYFQDTVVYAPITSLSVFAVKLPAVPPRLTTACLQMGRYPGGQHQRETLFDWGEETGRAARAAASATIADYRRRLEA